MLPRDASSGAQALAWIDAGDVFDVAIIDVQMPQMDGYQLAAQLRQRRTPAQLPLLVLTSLGDAGDRLQGLGVAQTLMKPTKSQVLFDSLCSLFDRPATASATSAGLAPLPAAAPPVRKEPRLAQMLPLRILVAEDNLVNQRVATLILTGMGYQIQMAANGIVALELLAAAEAAGTPFEVVLMDVQMPEMDGLECTRQICTAYPPARRPWIVAMTANAMEGDREDCMAAGMNDYVTKPIRGKDVTDALRRAGEGLLHRK
jgi:CheY-like chemotaxis protein